MLRLEHADADDERDHRAPQHEPARLGPRLQGAPPHWLAYISTPDLDATVADVADSDFGDGGTNRVGHIAWFAYNPADWKPYASRQRWFRTPNDAFLTGNFHPARSIMQKALPVNTLSWFQVLLASEFGGAVNASLQIMAGDWLFNQTDYEKARYRYQVARDLLANTGLSVTEIAATLVYADTAAFTRAFRRWSGRSPSAWRRSR